MTNTLNNAHYMMAHLAMALPSAERTNSALRDNYTMLHNEQDEKITYFGDDTLAELFNFDGDKLNRWERRFWQDQYE